jgi:hypothetical protein
MAMSRKPLSPLIIAVLVLGAPLWARRRHKTDQPTAVKMEYTNHNMVAVRCQINGSARRYLCVIDSGASHTVISDRVLKAAGPLVDMTTANGVIHVYQREVSLTIADGLELKSNALVEPHMTEDIDILLGQDVLRQFRSVVFDYDNQQVEFHR